MNQVHPADASAIRDRLERSGQGAVLRFWENLAKPERAAFAAQLETIDLELVQRLAHTWIDGEPEVHNYTTIEAAPVFSAFDPSRSECVEAQRCGEEALTAGRVGFLLVAGGQGTRLGFDGPKGSYAVGPVTGRSLFACFADRIRRVQARYGGRPPWYVMVGEQNEAATKTFFQEHDFFGFDPEQIQFFKQAMMPCVDETGRLILEERGRISANPNGHGGVIPAFVEAGLLDDARRRGVDTLHYFQVDNYAVRLGDPYFIGLHIQNESEFSAKVCRKEDPREAAGVFCVCDGKTRVIEYTELDLYPQLLETDAEGHPVHFAANTAIHVLSTDFVERVHKRFGDFPWHCSHKQIPYLDEHGELVEPAKPNGYKFETFIFDSLAYCERPPVLLEVPRGGEFTPIKRMEGADSVESARASMRRHWASWLDTAGYSIPDGVDIEISPRFASSLQDFTERAQGRDWSFDGPISIGPDGELGWKG